MDSAVQTYSVEELVELGRQMIADGKAHVAVRYLQRALSIDPRDAMAHAWLALAYTETNRPKQAMQEALLGIALEPDNPDVYVLAGLVFRICGRFRNAEEALRKAIELHPTYTYAFALLASVRCAQSRWEEAVQLAQHALQLDPSDSVARFVLSLAYCFLGRLDESEQIARHLLASNPENSEALSVLAMVAVQRKRWREARQLSLDALAIDPENDLAHEALIQAVGVRSKIMIPVLKFQFWLARMTPVKQVIAVVLLYATVRFMRSLAKGEIVALGESSLLRGTLYGVAVLLGLFWLYVVWAPLIFRFVLRRARDRRVRESARRSYE